MDIPTFADARVVLDDHGWLCGFWFKNRWITDPYLGDDWISEVTPDYYALSQRDAKKLVAYNEGKRREIDRHIAYIRGFIARWEEHVDRSSDSEMEAKLCDEWAAFCTTHGFPCLSADEIVLEGSDA